MNWLIQPTVNNLTPNATTPRVGRRTSSLNTNVIMPHGGDPLVDLAVFLQELQASWWSEGPVTRANVRRVRDKHSLVKTWLRWAIDDVSLLLQAEASGITVPRADVSLMAAAMKHDPVFGVGRKLLREMAQRVRAKLVKQAKREQARVSRDLRHTRRIRGRAALLGGMLLTSGTASALASMSHPIPPPTPGPITTHTNMGPQASIQPPPRQCTAYDLVRMRNSGAGQCGPDGRWCPKIECVL